MDEAGSWDNLNERFEVKRINHQEVYPPDCPALLTEDSLRIPTAESGHTTQ